MLGEKYGIPIPVWGSLVDKCVFDMDNGHFEYREQIWIIYHIRCLTRFKKYGKLDS